MSLPMHPPMWYGGDNFHLIKRGAPTHVNGPKKDRGAGKKQYQPPLDPDWRRPWGHGWMVTRGVIDRDSPL